MKKDNEVIEGTVVEETVVETSTEVVETKKNLFGKVKDGVNKNGKKVVAGIVILAAVGVGYMFGKSNGSNGESTYDDNYCDNDSDSDNNESENNNF